MKLLAIFTGPYALFAKWGVITLLVAAFSGWSWFKGNEHGTQKLVDYRGKQAVEAVRINAVREVVTVKVVNRYVKVAGETKIKIETIEKEVVKYAESNTGSCLDSDWRRLHDSAALNTVPEAARGVNGPGGTPKAAAALETVTQNYAACTRNADRLDFLQDWVREQQKVK